MIILTNKQELAKVCNFEPASKMDLKRLDQAWDIYTLCIKNNNPAALGNASEALQQRPRSPKMWKARNRQEFNEADTRPLIDGRYRPCEHKHNGGRIDDIVDKYIIYFIFYSNSTGTKYIEPRIMKTETFLSKLEEFNAIKVINKNHVFDGYGIQVSNRKLWAWLETQPIFRHEVAYNSSDFE